MKFGFARIIVAAFLLFSFLFFFLYRPLAYRAAYEDAVLTAVSAQARQQDQIIAVGPQVRAADSALGIRLQALRAKCAPRCSDVVSTAAEVASVSAIARDARAEITTRTFNPDGSVDLIVSTSQAGALRFLDALQRLPVPIRLERAILSAAGTKVKMEVTGQIVTGVPT